MTWECKKAKLKRFVICPKMVQKANFLLKNEIERCVYLYVIGRCRATPKIKIK